MQSRSYIYKFTAHTEGTIIFYKLMIPRDRYIDYLMKLKLNITE